MTGDAPGSAGLRHPQTAVAVAAITRDVDATTGLVLTVREPASGDPVMPAGFPAPTLYVTLAGISLAGSRGVFADAHDSGAEWPARIADTVHEEMVEELWALGRDTAWPSCPQHPRAHPLRVEARGDRAMWVCPNDGVGVCAVGDLDSPPADAQGRLDRRSLTDGTHLTHTPSRSSMSDETAATIDPSNNPETRSASGDRSPGTARAGGRSLPPEMLDARDAVGPDGTAAGDPLAGVTISTKDAEDAVPGDTGPENPGARPH